MNNTTETYHIYFDPGLFAVVMDWNGYSTSRQFREGTELMLNTLVQHQTYKVLADIKDMTLIGMEDLEWLERDFLPRAIHFGFRSIAIVRPESYFNKVAVESINYKIDKEKLAINYFDNVEEAKSWLKII
jgi:hypothetical protein